MLKQRVFTALLLAGILIAVIFYGSKTLFAILVIAAVFYAAWEWARLCNNQNGVTRKLYAVLLTLLLTGAYFFIPAEGKIFIFIAGSLWWCMAGIMVFFFQGGKKTVPEKRIVNYLIGFLVLVPSSLGLVYLYESNNGKYLVLMLFVLIWVVDSTAYFIGRRWGKLRLADKVSPGKSVEGFLGSLLMAGVPATVYIYIKGITGIEILWIILLFIITAVFSVVGDLFESMFKRNVNLKDSGNLLPGHGGLLDRIDSLTAAAPLFISGLWLLGERT